MNVIVAGGNHQLQRKTTSSEKGVCRQARKKALTQTVCKRDSILKKKILGNEEKK